MSLAGRMILLAALSAMLVAFGLFIAGGDTTAVLHDAPRFHSSVQCAGCHREVWDEWWGSHHQIAYLNPEVRQLSDDFRNKECQACHLPRPVAVTGYGKRTLHRTTLPDEGVGCLTCHLGRDGQVLGRRAVPGAPCRPRASAELTSVALCESCHNQHGTTDQWRATPLAAAGVDCNACHMPAVERTGGRRGRGHGFAGSHDVEVLREALAVQNRVDGDELLIAVANTGAGHNFPTEERSRAGDVVVCFDGAAPERVHRFRLPYRSEPLADTTLPHGATETIRVPIPAGTSRVRVRVWYRLTPFVGDDDPRSALLFEQEIDLAGVVPAPGPLRRPDLPERSAFRPDPDPTTLPPVPPVPGAAELVLQGVPPLVLAPRLPRFRELVAAAPAPPDAARMEQLRELLGVAFTPEVASRGTSARFRRNLLEQPDAFWVLEEALATAAVEVRAQAAYELGQLGHARSVIPLVLRLKYELDHPAVLVWVVDALARLGNRSGLPDLVRLFDRADAAQLAGERGLAICREAGVEMSDAPSWDELRGHLRKLYDAWRAGRPPSALPPSTLPPSTDPLTDPLIRARIAGHLVELEAFQLRGVDEARFVLQRLGAAPVPMLREALHAVEPYLRTHALEILRELGPQADVATADMLPLLRDSLTAADAARALGGIGARVAAPHLERCLGSGDLELRAAAAGALGRLGAVAATGSLRRLFADAAQPIDVRVQAAFSLALLESDGGATTWLEELAARGGYHAATLRELLERIRDRR